MTKREYEPVIRALGDGTYEQTFGGAYAAVEVAGGSVTLAVADHEYGAVHGLYISSPETEPFSAEDVYVEYNDQANGCSGTDVTVSLTARQLQLEYSDEVEALTGRISYEAEADPFIEPRTSYEFPLRRVVVNLTVNTQTLTALRDELQRLHRNGMRIDLAV